MKYLGYTLTKEELEEAFLKFKEFADMKKEVFDSDIDAIVTNKTISVEEICVLESFEVRSGNEIPATAKIKLKFRGEPKEVEATGDGPIEAAYSAIEKIVGATYPLEQLQHKRNFRR